MGTQAAHDVFANTMIPDLLAKHPEARAVLDRYGLRGCGGRLGPHEPIAFYARLHGVDESVLLGELRQVITAGGPAETLAAGVSDTIYRRFFVGGIAVILTVGAAWGAWILWKIGFADSFTGVSIHEVNAHGHAQIFGWVGLVIMGFAYQAFPRFWHINLVAPRLAVAVFVAMVLGIIVRTLAMAVPGQTWALPAAMLGGGLEIFAITTFAAQLLVTFLRSEARFEPYLGYVFVGLACFVLQALLCVWHGWNLMTASSKDELLYYVQVYQPVLRTLQVHGLALLMVLGVSQRLLPGAYGLAIIPARLAWICLAMLLIAIIGQVALFLGQAWTGDHIWGRLMILPWGILAVGSLGLVWPWKLWRPLPEHDRSAKFIRAAYAWLAISMAMLLLLPVYALATDIAFSHAYYGAVRHAITVGFVTLMIMGVAAKVVPTLSGIDPRSLSPLWGPFLLVNAGCALRVSLQTLTDFHPGFFGVVGVSGMLELAGLAWWGLPLLGIMRRGRIAEAAIPTTPAPRQILGHHTPSDVLAWFPQTAETFDRLGFSPLRNPAIRRTAGRVTTLAQAAALRRVPLSDLLENLNSAAGLIDSANEARSRS